MTNVQSFPELLPFWRKLIFSIVDLLKCYVGKRIIINGRQLQVFSFYAKDLSTAFSL